MAEPRTLLALLNSTSTGDAEAKEALEARITKFEKLAAEHGAAVATAERLVTVMHKSCPTCHGELRYVVGPPNGDGVTTKTPCTHPVHWAAREAAGESGAVPKSPSTPLEESRRTLARGRNEGLELAARKATRRGLDDLADEIRNMKVKPT